MSDKCPSIKKDILGTKKKYENYKKNTQWTVIAENVAVAKTYDGQTD